MAVADSYRAIVATYNIHGNVGGDRMADPHRIAAVVNEIGPDVVGMQEVLMSGSTDNACGVKTVEQETGLHAVFGRTRRQNDQDFGNLLLSRWPVLGHRWIDLSAPPFEERGAIVACLDTPNGPMRVVATHLALRPAARIRQVDRLRLSLQEGEDKCMSPTLFLGDFNCWGGSQRMLRPLGAPGERRYRPRSFPAWRPIMALDRIWSVPNDLVDSIIVHRSELARRASDHLPVVGRLDWPRPGPVGAGAGDTAAAL